MAKSSVGRSVMIPPVGSGHGGGAAARGQWRNVLKGIDMTLEIFKRMPKAARAAAHQTMIGWAGEIFDVSQMLTPVSRPEDGPPTVAHGHLKDSGQVIIEGELRISIRYTAWYAIYVHEVPRSHRVGQWRFLAAAVDQVAPEMMREMGTRFSAFFAATMAGGSPLVTGRRAPKEGQRIWGRRFAEGQRYTIGTATRDSAEFGFTPGLG